MMALVALVGTDSTLGWASCTCESCTIIEGAYPPMLDRWDG